MANKKLSKKLITAVDLKDGWDRYLDTFGDCPHGTQAQLSALFELIPTHPAGRDLMERENGGK